MKLSENCKAGYYTACYKRGTWLWCEDSSHDWRKKDEKNRPVAV